MRVQVKSDDVIDARKHGAKQRKIRKSGKSLSSRHRPVKNPQRGDLP